MSGNLYKELYMHESRLIDLREHMRANKNYEALQLHCLRLCDEVLALPSLIVRLHESKGENQMEDWKKLELVSKAMKDVLECLRDATHKKEWDDVSKAINAIYRVKDLL